jgi:hypothetical protein
LPTNQAWELKSVNPSIIVVGNAYAAAALPVTPAVAQFGYYSVPDALLV